MFSETLYRVSMYGTNAVRIILKTLYFKKMVKLERVTVNCNHFQDTLI